MEQYLGRRDHQFSEWEQWVWMESEIRRGSSGAGELLNWGSRTTDLEQMRVVDWV